jgi:hypothetical protein
VASTSLSSTTDKSKAKSSTLASCAQLLKQKVTPNTPPSHRVALCGRRRRVHAQEPECHMCKLQKLLTPIERPRAYVAGKKWPGRVAGTGSLSAIIQCQRYKKSLRHTTNTAAFQCFVMGCLMLCGSASQVPTDRIQQHEIHSSARRGICLMPSVHFLGLPLTEPGTAPGTERHS